MRAVQILARPLLATIFVTGGYGAVRNPGPSAQRAEPFIGDLAKSLPGISSTEDLVRLDGAVKVAAGTMLALGRMPRLRALALIASLAVTTAAAHRYWEDDDPQMRAAHQIHFNKNLSLIGGLLFAATAPRRTTS